MTDQETILKATQTAEWLHERVWCDFTESFFSFLKEIRENNKKRWSDENRGLFFGYEEEIEDYLHEKYGILIERKWDAYYIGAYRSRDRFFNCYLRHLRDNTSALAKRLPEDFRTEEFIVFQEKIKELWDIDNFLNRFFIFVDFKCSFDNKETSESLWIFHRTPIFALED
jgi:hypothetical protein